MATITLSITAGAQTVTASVTVSDANAQRLSTDLQAALNATPQQLMNQGLRKLVQNAIAIATNYERAQTAIPPFPVT